jgi:hypothetical protein
LAASDEYECTQCGAKFLVIRVTNTIPPGAVYSALPGNGSNLVSGGLALREVKSEVREEGNLAEH